MLGELFEFEYKLSRLYLGFLVFAYVGAVINIIFFIKLNILIKIFLILLMSVIFLKNIYSVKLIKKIIYTEKTGWKLMDKNKKIIEAKLNPFNLCTPWVVGLDFNVRSVLIFYDAMNKEDFRRLRVLLINS